MDYKQKIEERLKGYQEEVKILGIKISELTSLLPVEEDESIETSPTIEQHSTEKEIKSKYGNFEVEITNYKNKKKTVRTKIRYIIKSKNKKLINAVGTISEGRTFIEKIIDNVLKKYYDKKDVEYSSGFGIDTKHGNFIGYGAGISIFNSKKPNLFIASLSYNIHREFKEHPDTISCDSLQLLYEMVEPPKKTKVRKITKKKVIKKSVVKKKRKK